MVTPKQGSKVKRERKHTTTQRKSCDTCHKSKTRCDRKRPVCSTCEIFARRCTYRHRDEHGASGPSSTIEQTSALHSPASSTSQDAQQVDSKEHLSHLNRPKGFSIDTDNVASSSNTQLPSPSSGGSSLYDGIGSLDELITSSSFPSTDSVLTSPVQQCGFCFDPACESCQQRLDLSFTTMRSEHALLLSQTFRSEQSSTAQALIEAMAAKSDRESSTILAAIRIGMPWNAIHNALLHPDCSTDGLASVLEKQRISQPQMPDVTASMLDQMTFTQDEEQPVASSRNVWDRLSPLSHGNEQLEEFIGVIGSRRGSKEAVPPSLTHQSSSKVGELGNDIRVPIWAILPRHINTQISDPFDEAFNMIQSELAAGVDVEAYCGQHAYLGALLHPNTTHSIPRLSQIVAGLVKSILPEEGSPSVTTLAIMYLHWCIWSWMLSPTAENFRRMPRAVRPTPWQICKPHILVYDFVVNPTLRDYICRESLTLNTWLTEACKTTVFAWSKTALHALCRHPQTKAIDLHPDCKAQAGRSENWSFGPSVRAHLPNVDQYTTIRASTTP